ncbi:hypothetical protein AVEN_150911-1 [Araneus ventricosus]|uniref:Tc1-like transposase DDE domain-containing protein n=1 Tax=Araneus ventricosus TaxID=182803 RepID=A0A4Y2C9L8_ARAVE|nr:hypothetical protein AVEN_150911-1 [Araneus ventricosus]
MPGRRVGRHFSELSEFERGLIIGMKTTGWSTRRVDRQVDRSECAVRTCWQQWTRDGTHVRRTGLERPGAIFQQDNARPHTSRIAQDFLRHVQTLPWPARSPYLSPTEHVWDHLKRQMPLCHSVHDLEVAVQDLWVHLPQNNIRRLINRMPDRVEACIAAGGGPTCY